MCLRNLKQHVHASNLKSLFLAFGVVLQNNLKDGAGLGLQWYSAILEETKQDRQFTTASSTACKICGVVNLLNTFGQLTECVDFYVLQLPRGNIGEIVDNESRFFFFSASSVPRRHLQRSDCTTTWVPWLLWGLMMVVASVVVPPPQPAQISGISVLSKYLAYVLFRRERTTP